MKKIALILMLLCALVFTSCSGTPTEGTTDSDANGSGASANGSDAADVTIEEAVLVDEAGVKITVKGMEEGILGTEIKLLVENDTDKDLCVQARNCSVNGYMSDPIMSVEVTAGKKANDDITFMDLDDLGITAIADIELSFHIFEMDNLEGSYLDTEMIQIKTSIADSYEYKFDDSGDVVYDDGTVKIVSKGIKTNEILGPSLVFYVQNSGDQPIAVSVNDVSANDFMVYASFYQEVLPGKHALSDVSFLSSSLEENGITDIEKVELSFRIYYSDDFSAYKDSDVITLNF